MRLFFYVTLQRKSEQKTMKKSLLIAGILATSAVFISGCSKDDTEAPVITLAGDNPYVLDIFEDYDEPGFEALDNEDGDLTSSVSVDNSGLAVSLPAEITYSVSDAAGNNETVSRTVSSNTRTYTVYDTCGTGASAVGFTYTQSVTMTNATTIGFNKFGDYSNNSAIVATFTTAGQITLASQLAQDIGSAADDHRFSGTGTVTATGFTLSYTDENITTSSITNCVATFVK